MKILHVIAQLPSKTGSGVYFSSAIEALKKFGHEQAAVFASQDNNCFDILDGAAQYPVLFKSKRIPFPIAGMSDVMPYESTVYSSMDDEMMAVWQGAFMEALKRAQAEFRPDVLILHHLWILTSIATGLFDSQIKIGICHNTDIRQAEQNPDMKNRYVTNLKNLDAIFALSDSNKHTIIEVFGIKGAKIVTMGGGFNQNLFFPIAAKNKKAVTKIVFSGKIEKSKGIFELVKAFNIIAETKPNLHLDIIGDPQGNNARLLSSLVGDACNISIVPPMSQQDLAPFLRERDIYAMPSYYEGIALMAIECLASGLRVVASEIEALMSLLGPDVNNSGVIEYVKLPRIYDTDKPYDEDLPQFIKDLTGKLLIQIERVENCEPYPGGALSEINKHSWNGLAEKINREILSLTGLY
ncbi:MAG: glycosyltransferase family 4 protein [Oscillospiraceae bacterium]|jgi:glycosyltransferase involved in cell wall biosynthesis|nr:glycosyltransferase family 4 protein [Oscillospiraceae bacterium]